ncbi:HAD-IIA family hydrolase [Sulfurimonas sp. HSL3-7]|uniref:HAD-IIA family hydrolase n=1 Tax=Sulfonitrofixus jiaomeiensis TaxID=3131938 RepID=UPI0031F8EE46
MFFIDVQGTLIDDEKRLPINGALDFIARLNREKIPYMIITNNTKQGSEAFRSYLNSLGFAIDEAHYLDPLMLLSSKIAEGSRVAAYGSEPFLNELVKLGYRLDYTAPESVVIGIKQHFDSEEYAQIIGFLLEGSKLVGMHQSTLYAKENKRYPGVGAILKMLSFATSADYEVVGKPSELFYLRALEKLQMQEKEASFDKITIISDDVKGDLVGAKVLGMRTVFVLSGKYKKAEEIIPMLERSQQPALICSDMMEVGEKV